MALVHNPTVFVIDDDAGTRASIPIEIGSWSDVLSRCTAGVVFAHRS